MEFLDPQAERRHRILLFIGYGLITIAIAIASLVMLYWSYGYSLTNDGEVQQSGLVFVSSQPEGATITLNGKAETSKTNARLTLTSGSYDMRINLAGYRQWSHNFNVEGGDVQRIIYPRLFPSKLTSTSIRNFEAEPTVASQSPNHRWLLIKNAATSNTFLLYDLRQPEEPIAADVTIPLESITAGDGAQSWTVVEWAGNDQYILLSHSYTTGETTGQEYILLDRTSGERTQNLTRTLTLSVDDELTLFDKKFDQYYAYNKQTKSLRSFTASGKALVAQIDHVLAYKTHGDSSVLFVTDVNEDGTQSASTVNVVLLQNSRRMVLRQLPATSAGYVLNLAQYDNAWYIAAGATDGGGVYLYRNPSEQVVLKGKPYQTWRYLRVQNPSNVSFSANSQFVLAENGQTCVIYDAENIEVKRFILSRALDAPQTKVQWMDGHRLTYVSGGKVIVVEYDNQNMVELQDSLPQFAAYYSGNYEYAFTIAKTQSATTQLTSTPLIIVK